MERTQVESSQIRSIGFDACRSKMDVEFKPGSIYRYSNVSQEVFDTFMKSESKGRFFGQIIKSDPGKYPFKKIRGTDRQVSKETGSKEADDGKDV